MEFLVFTADPERARAVIRAGADGVIVDWENKGKPERQRGADTEINSFGPADLLRIRESIEGRLICRINGMHSGTVEEVEAAIDQGANEIFLPMVRRVSEVEQFLKLLRSRAEGSILMETRDAVELASELGVLPLRRIYVGLNDLAIDRRIGNLFESVADGTLDRIRPQIKTAFGFGGLTLPDRGTPIPCHLLLNELIRLQCNFTFLRRSFWRDVQRQDLAAQMQKMRAAVLAMREADGEALASGSSAFRAAVTALNGGGENRLWTNAG